MLLFNPTRASLLQGGRELTKHPGRASFSYRTSDDVATRKADSFRVRSITSPELTGKKSAESPARTKSAESPALTSRLGHLAVQGTVSRAEQLNQDPLHL
jgi:hypothetical protein